MPKVDIPHKHIAIEGNIGTGKTTLCRKLQKDWDCRLVLEQFSDNPFLPLFYKEPERYAFPVELFFMTERHRQLQAAFAQPDIFSPHIIADYFFIKTLLFAGKNLDEPELQLFRRLFHTLNNTFPKPDLLVYLHRPVEVLQRQIQQRGRDYEQDIDPQYLSSIQQAYFDYFRTEQEIPILILNLGAGDFTRSSELYQQIQEEIAKAYPPGISRKDI